MQDRELRRLLQDARLLGGRVYRQKANHRWAVDLNVHGQRIRRVVGSKAEAEAVLRDLRQSKLRPGHPALLTDILHNYMTTLRLRGKARSSFDAERHVEHLRRLIAGAGVADAARLSGADIDTFVRDRLAEGVSRPTVNGSLRILRAALNHAVASGQLDRLPVRVRLLRETKKLPTALSVEEVDRLVTLATSPYDLILLLAAKAGLRHQEILHTKVGDVDFANRSVRVSAKPEVNWSPKSHAERDVPLASSLVERLRAAAAGRRANEWLFPGTERGRPLVAAHEPIREVFKRAGLYRPSLRPGLHVLRRTFATELLGKGVDVETVRQLGGWSDLSVVMRYVTSSDARKRRAIEALDL